MKYRNEESRPFLYEGGDDGAAPADNEAPAADGADKKEEISDEEAIKRAIERNKKLIAAAKAKAVKEHGKKSDGGEGEPDLNPDAISQSL